MINHSPSKCEPDIWALVLMFAVMLSSKPGTPAVVLGMVALVWLGSLVLRSVRATLDFKGGWNVFWHKAENKYR